MEDYEVEYNNNCNENFKTNINNKYSISFYSDKNKKKFISLFDLNNKILWCEYKILCCYDKKKNILKNAKDIIIIEKSILDNKIKLDNIKNINELEKNIMKKTLDNNYIGYIKHKINNIYYYILIEKIIRM